MDSVDAERAGKSPFGSTIAHGLLSLSLGPALMEELRAFDGFGHSLNYGYEKVHFPAPLPVGSRIRMRATIQSIDNVGGGSAQVVTSRSSMLHVLEVAERRRVGAWPPEHAALIQRVLAIPPKRCDRAVVTYLTQPEIDALLASPDQGTWLGRRDHTLLIVALQTEVTVGGEVEQRMDRAQPRVAGAHADAAFDFEVSQDRADQDGVEVSEVQLVGCLAGLPVGVAK